MLRLSDVRCAGAGPVSAVIIRATGQPIACAAITGLAIRIITTIAHHVKEKPSQCGTS